MHACKQTTFQSSLAFSEILTLRTRRALIYPSATEKNPKKTLSLSRSNAPQDVEIKDWYLLLSTSCLARVPAVCCAVVVSGNSLQVRCTAPSPRSAGRDVRERDRAGIKTVVISKYL